MKVVKEVESEMGELGREEAGFRVGQRSQMINWDQGEKRGGSGR